MSGAASIDEILVDRLPGETRAALMSRGRLVELLVLRPDRESRVGAIIRGRVTALRRDQGAAYVEIGAAKAGFLSLRRGAKPPDEGATAIVQVTKDAAGDKGAGVTDRPLVVGRYLTLRPGQPGLERARRLDPADFETAAKALADIDTAADGFMLHPSAAAAESGSLAAEAKALILLWRDAVARRGAVPATLIAAPDPVLRAILGHAGTLEAAWFDDSDALNRARADLKRLAPEMETKLRRHDGAGALFDRHDAEAQIAEALARRVRLKRGGELVIDELEAMTVIDVDMAGHQGSAQQSVGQQGDAALAVNLEAADEIARQLRLRDIGGIVVVDFLRLAAAPQRKRVVEAMRRAASGDPQQVDVLGMTPAGLVELTRRRGRPSLARLLAEGRDPVPTPLTLGFALLRRALREAAHAPARRLRARATPAVVAALEAERASLDWTRQRLGATLTLVPDATMAPDQFDISPE